MISPQPKPRGFSPQVSAEALARVIRRVAPEYGRLTYTEAMMLCYSNPKWQFMWIAISQKLAGYPFKNPRKIFATRVMGKIK